MGKVKNIEQFLEAIPERVVKWEQGGGENLAVLLVPRFRRGPFGKWLQPRLRKPYIRVNLDEIGTAVWENCDGKKSVKEIGYELTQKFGDRVVPVNDRLTKFFDTLYRGRFVRYWQRETNKPHLFPPSVFFI